VIDVAFAPDGASLVSAGDDGNDLIWSSVNGATIAHPVGRYPTAVAWSPNGVCVATATSSGSIVIWAVRTGVDVAHLSGVHDRIYGLAWSPDGRWLASGSWDGTAVIWDVGSGSIRATYRSPGGVGHVAWTRDSSSVAVATASGQVVLLHAADATPVWTAHVADAPLWSLALSPDASTIAVGVGDYGVTMAGHYAVYLIDAVSGRTRRSLHLSTGPVWTLAYSPDGLRLAAAGGSFGGLHPPKAYADYRVIVVRSGDGATLGQDSSHTDSVWGLSWSPDGGILASASQDGTVQLAESPQ
jgi:WD40 repeat protein